MLLCFVGGPSLEIDELAIRGGEEFKIIQKKIRKNKPKKWKKNPI